MKLSLIFSICVIFLTPTAKSEIKDREMQGYAQRIIAEFRAGKSFAPVKSTNDLLRAQRVDPASLRILANELSDGTATTRENIVRLLEHLGLELDQPAPGKLKTIRDKEIIKVLLTAGFMKNDSAYHLSATILADRCRPGDLAEFEQIYLQSLKDNRGDYLFILAKAKVHKGASLLEQMARLPKWQKDKDREKALRIARAALGNMMIENEFISEVYAAENDAPPAPKNNFYDTSEEQDGKNVAEQLYNLGLIGTKNSLAAACKFLRSPLKTYVPNHRERSIRHDALDAIRYNYPEEGVLLKPKKYSDWVAAEQFCIDNFGVVFDGPTPDLKPDRPYPIR